MTMTGGGGALDLEQQVLVITVAPAPAKHGTDVGVDGLDRSERDLLLAVVQEAVEVLGEELDMSPGMQILTWRIPLPVPSRRPFESSSSAPRKNPRFTWSPMT
jgi:hypothetical protein